MHFTHTKKKVNQLKEKEKLIETKESRGWLM